MVASLNSRLERNKEEEEEDSVCALPHATRAPPVRFRVQGSGFRVQGSGFRVQGAGCRVQGAGFRVWGLSSRSLSLAGNLLEHARPPSAVLAVLELDPERLMREEH